MTITPSFFIVIVTVTLVAVISPATLINGLGSGGTVAISYGTSTVCGIVAEEPTQRIVCYRGGQNITVEPNSSFSSISGGRDFFCGLMSGGNIILCWDTTASNTSLNVDRRVYYNETVPLGNLTVGDDQVCAIVMDTGAERCWWRGERKDLPTSPFGGDQFMSISSGIGYSCGILLNNRAIRCWGSNATATQIQDQFSNKPMSSIVAGGSHVCGLNTSGFLLCGGNNDSGQLNVPGSAMGYSGLSLGANYSCAIRQLIQSVVCWGGGSEFSMNVTEGVSFESIVSGLNYTCGLTTRNFSVICWGPGWLSNNNNNSSSGIDLPLPKILPGPCVQSSSCDCGIYELSQSLCYGSASVCKPCGVQNLAPPPNPSAAPPPPSIVNALMVITCYWTFCIVA